MTRLAVRRARHVVATLVGAAALVVLHAVLAATFRPLSYLTGWALLGSVLLLAAYNLRKKVPFLPLGSTSSWLQVHLYLGAASVLLFVQHAGLRVPDGALEVTLATLYVLVVLSGAAGIVLSRFLPQRLNRRGETVLFERIPSFRARLRERLRDLVARSVAETDRTTLADFCASRVVPFFETPGSGWRHLLGVSREGPALLAGLADLDRYLGDKEKAATGEITTLIRVKDDLDYQRAAQGILKLWLFVHVPLTHAMLLLTVVHVWLAHAFGRGLR